MTTSLEATLADVGAALDRQGWPWALVGGLAVSARAEPRLTRDADLAVSVVDDAEAEAVVHDLVTDGYHALATVDHDPTGRLATVRLARGPGDSVVVDLLFASSGIEPEIADGADVIEVVPGLSVPVARAGHLIAMKLLARDDRARPADADDLERLADVADADDWRDAEIAVGLIHERGYDRGRDLTTALAELRSHG